MVELNCQKFSLRLLNLMHKDSINLQFEVDKKDIAYLTGVIEGYDYLAVLRTLDQDRGLIELLISPDFLDDTLNLVEALKNEIPIRQIQPSRE